MHIFANTFTRGLSRWGIFTNLFTGEDFWYFDVHTPWIQVHIYETETWVPSFTLL